MTNAKQIKTYPPIQLNSPDDRVCEKIIYYAFNFFLVWCFELVESRSEWLSCLIRSNIKAGVVYSNDGVLIADIYDDNYQDWLKNRLSCQYGEGNL
jgi:hypothetical protein